MFMEPALVRSIVEKLEDLKGSNISVLPVGHLCDFADWMVVCTGRSSRHVCAMADVLAEYLKPSTGIAPSVEGKEGGEWVLIDGGLVIVHLMQADTRQLYALEHLWAS